MVAAAPGTLEHLPGSLADLLLPAGSGGLAAYRDRLLAQDAFPGEEARLRGLPAVEVSRPFTRAAEPTIGVILCEADELTPHLADASGLRSILATIRAAGARPVLIPPRLDVVLPADPRARRTALDAMTAQLDGVVGIGGWDVDPAIYGAENTDSRHTNLARDRSERELVLSAMNADLFMFGICRSHQFWNAARGARLIQDIQAEGYAHAPHDTRKFGLSNGEPLATSDFSHRVQLAPGMARSILRGRRAVVTNARHHQGFAAPGEGMRATGFVTDPVTGKQLVEVTESDRILTTQFHPEDMKNEVHGLLAAAVRRAHVFRMLKDDASRSIGALLGRMHRSPVRFEGSDYAWARRTLAARFARTLPRVA